MRKEIQDKFWFNVKRVYNIGLTDVGVNYQTLRMRSHQFSGTITIYSFKRTFQMMYSVIENKKKCKPSFRTEGKKEETNIR